MPNPREVVVVGGATKSGKTGIGALLQAYGDFQRCEFSAPIIARLPDPSNPSTPAIIELIRKLRRDSGPDALARVLVELIREEVANPRVVIAGLRSKWDLDYLETTFPMAIFLYVHVTPEYRLRYLLEDPTSGIRNRAEFFVAESQNAGETPQALASRADAVVINEPGFPLTPLEQLRLWVSRLMPQIRLHDSQWRDLGDATESSVSYSKFMGRRGLSPFSQDSIVREHRLDRDDHRGDYFHEISELLIVVDDGEVLVRLRRGFLTEESHSVHSLFAGEIMAIQPGWAFRLVAMTDGTVIRFCKRPQCVPTADIVHDLL